jgi:hypothetical protein
VLFGFLVVNGAGTDYHDSCSRSLACHLLLISASKTDVTLPIPGRGLLMSSTARALFPTTVLFVLVAGPLVADAHASSTLVSYAYSGTIQSVSQQATTATGVVVGDKITGTFAYDSSQTGNATTGQFTFTGSSKVHTFALKIFNSAGQQVFTDSYSGNVSAYYFGQVTYVNSSLTTFNIEGDTIYKQGLGVTKQAGDIAFNLAMSDTSGAGGFSPTNQPLPTPTTIKDFVSNSGVLTWDPVDQTFTADVKFTNSSVPEPSSWLMAAIALLAGTAVTFMAYRRRAAAPKICPQSV